MIQEFYRRHGKRIFDLAVAIPLLFVLAPILAITGLLVRVFLGSPVLYRQERPGFQGGLFRIYKFRTMTDDRDLHGNLLHDDLRLTVFGKFLRASSLDELPELWNVIKGEMSLVGPRPLRVQYLSLYSPEQSLRHDVLPGITGWAQVNGRNSIDWEERFEMDVWYTRHVSLSLDLRIIFRTLSAVVFREGIAAEGHGTMPYFEGVQKPDVKQVLALEGGKPIRTGSMSAWPYFDDELIEATAKVLRSNRVNYWTGNECRMFEQEYAEAIGAKHAIALANGTVALELALYGLGIGPGDEVIVPSRTFIASASCVVMRGAKPVVADVDQESQTLTAETIQAALTPRTRAIIAVHLAGWPCDMDPIMELARQNDLKVIEDCAQAHHATYKGRHVGSIGHVGAFSFCQDKIMTTGGEGGLLTTNDTDLWDKCWSFKDHGKSQDALQQSPSPHLFRWLHRSFGTNWRLTEMQAAMGRIMLRRLPEWVAARRRNAAMLTAMLSAIPSLRIPLPPAHSSHSYYKFYAFLRPDWLDAEWSRDRIVQNIQAEGIPCGPGSCSEIYLEQAFDGLDLRPSERLKIARELGETSLMFMVHPTLTHNEISETARAIEKIMNAATLHQIRRRSFGTLEAIRNAS